MPPRTRFQSLLTALAKEKSLIESQLAKVSDAIAALGGVGESLPASAAYPESEDCRQKGRENDRRAAEGCVRAHAASTGPSGGLSLAGRSDNREVAYYLNLYSPATYEAFSTAAPSLASVPPVVGPERDPWGRGDESLDGCDELVLGRISWERFGSEFLPTSRESCPSTTTARRCVCRTVLRRWGSD